MEVEAVEGGGEVSGEREQEILRGAEWFNRAAIIHILIGFGYVGIIVAGVVFDFSGIVGVGGIGAYISLVAAQERAIQSSGVERPK